MAVDQRAHEIVRHRREQHQELRLEAAFEYFERAGPVLEPEARDDLDRRGPARLPDHDDALLERAQRELRIALLGIGVVDQGIEEAAERARTGLAPGAPFQLFAREDAAVELRDEEIRIHAGIGGDLGGAREAREPPGVVPEQDLGVALDDVRLGVVGFRCRADARDGERLGNPSEREQRIRHLDPRGDVSGAQGECRAAARERGLVVESVLVVGPGDRLQHEVPGVELAGLRQDPVDLGPALVGAGSPELRAQDEDGSRPELRKIPGRSELAHHAEIARGHRLAHLLAHGIGVEVHREDHQVLGLLRVRAVHAAAQATPVVEGQRDFFADLPLADALQGGHDIGALEVDAVVVEGLREGRVELDFALGIADRRDLLQAQVDQARAQLLVLLDECALALGGVEVLLRLRDEMSRALEHRRIGLTGLR